ncbi:hypothetical protein QYM36_014153 [Artemia franciscana]|uniref:Uncharacterized protein n=1 Tax=Artemia franciscana TaxID=6661 RepID=A0AA88KVC8_ARTSF|nr:hypothetical protein QYM36_014153 [Artemia franciscana]
MEKKNFSKSKPVTGEVPAEYISKQSYAVIVKNLPSNLAKPELRKDFLEQACPDVSSKMVELKCTRGDWKAIAASKCDGHAIGNALNSSSSIISAKVKSSSHFGIVRHVPNHMTSDDIKSLVPKCSKAKKSGPTRSFRMKFETKEDLFRAMKVPLVISLERLPIQEFLFLQKWNY